MGEVKQTNFRIDSESADKFRAFCEENGINHAQGFDRIIQIMELEKAKEVIPGRSVEIEEFQRHAKSLIDAYVGSLDIAQNTEARIYEQYKNMLESKDQQILDLQASVRAKEELATAANTAAMEAQNRQELAEKGIKEAEAREKAAQETARDKISIAEMLTAKLTEAEAKLKDYPSLTATLDQTKDELAKANQALKDAKKDAGAAQERAVAAVQREMDKALLEAEREKGTLERELRERIDKLQEEKASLKDQIADLKEKLLKQTKN